MIPSEQDTTDWEVTCPPSSAADEDEDEDEDENEDPFLALNLMIIMYITT